MPFDRHFTVSRHRPAVALLLFAVGFVAGLSASVRAADDSPKYLLCTMGVGGTGTDVVHVLGFINPDGSGERYPDFAQPNQKSWVFGPQLSGGRRILLSSFEGVDLKAVRSGQVKTRDWLYDISTGELTEILQKDRPSDQMRTHAMLPGDERVIASCIIGGEERAFVMNLDGSEQVELTEAGGGFHYAYALSHDHKRLACHVTGGKPAFYNPGAYSINVIDVATKARVLVAGDPAHLYFGPHWSPDDRWLVYLDCLHQEDPKHFRAALCVGAADGSGQRKITPDQSHWFGTPFGSNMSEWSPDGKTVTYTRLLADSTPDMSSGGAQLCLLNPDSGEITELTTAEPGKWDYRAAWSPDGKKLSFTRVHTGGVRELWTMNPDGSGQTRLTSGYQQKGADFGRWLTVK